MLAPTSLFFCVGQFPHKGFSNLLEGYNPGDSTGTICIKERWLESHLQLIFTRTSCFPLNTPVSPVPDVPHLKKYNFGIPCRWEKGHLPSYTDQKESLGSKQLLKQIFNQSSCLQLMICPIFWRYLFYQILQLNRINWLFLGFPHCCLTISFWTMHQLGFNQRSRPQRTSVCDYTEICYRDLALCDCGNWGSGFHKLPSSRLIPGLKSTDQTGQKGKRMQS